MAGFRGFKRKPGLIPRRAAAAGLLLALVLVPAELLAGDPQPVRARFVADASKIQVGQGFRVGVLLEIAPGWRIFWKNPGESGKATSVSFSTAPQGLHTGKLNWPAPIRFRPQGDLVGYGYEGSVLLFAEAEPPPWFQPGTVVTAKALVQWLACGPARCLPGKAELFERLPVAHGSNPANRTLFELWEDTLPVAANSAASLLRSYRLSGSLREGRFVLHVVWKEAPDTVAWIPSYTPALAVGAIQTETRGLKTRVSFRAAVPPGRKRPGEPFESLLVYTRIPGFTVADPDAVPSPAEASGIAAAVPKPKTEASPTDAQGGGKPLLRAVELPLALR